MTFLSILRPALSSMKKTLLGAALFASVLLGTGCMISKIKTQTGLPYWPDGGNTPAARLASTTVADAGRWRTAASRWLGVPYKVGGQDRDGIDCSGFTDKVYQEVTSLGLPRTSRGQWLNGAKVPSEAIQLGDLVFFQTTGSGVSHDGVSMGGNEFAHASTTKGVMFSSLTDPYWSQRFSGARRPGR